MNTNDIVKWLDKKEHAELVSFLMAEYTLKELNKEMKGEV